MEEKKDDKALQTQQKPQVALTLQDEIKSDRFKEAISTSLPSHLTAERFVRVALTAMMKTPKLAQCSKQSIFKCLLDLSSLGLEPDGRNAHLIPFENKKTGNTEAQLIIDYKGLIALALRSGEIKNIRAELVCQNDIFSWDNGIVSHKVDWFKPRGKILAVYSHVRKTNDVDDYEVMTLEEVQNIQKRSKAGQSGPWITDFNEMAKKTVIRRHTKRLTLSPEFNDALIKDDDKLDELHPSTQSPYSMQELMPQRLSEVETKIEAPEVDKKTDVVPITNDQESKAYRTA